MTRMDVSELDLHSFLVGTTPLPKSILMQYEWGQTSMCIKLNVANNTNDVSRCASRLRVRLSISEILNIPSFFNRIHQKHSMDTVCVALIIPRLYIRIIAWWPTVRHISLKLISPVHTKRSVFCLRKCALVIFSKISKWAKSSIYNVLGDVHCLWKGASKIVFRARRDSTVA